ncbi:hypothetical protein RMATCC62417_10637 [Rhizopus microsporus]|nr:hypothetical protein RMATCC62417_10637 [Rhizopus microsporus]
MVCFCSMYNIHFISHSTFAFNLIEDIEKCEDYDQAGHKNKGSYKCSLYVNKKRKIGSKDDAGTKIEKGKGKKKRLEKASSSKSNDQVQICKSCSQTGHKSARSKECSNYKATLDEALKNELGDNYGRFTRKVYLEAVIRPEYKESFTEKIIKLSAFIRNVLFRVQLSVNAYIVNNKDSADLTVITQQNFWYATSQLIMDQKITNRTYFSNSVALGFEDFEAEHPSIVFSLKDNPIKGYSDALSAACVVLATAYLNYTVKNFQRKVLYYLTVRLAIIYPDKPRGLLYKLAVDFCWEILINGEPKWPIQYFDLISIQNIAQMLLICNGLQARLFIPPTVQNLAASLAKFVPALAVMISELQKLCNDHKDDNAKMPGRFSLMPTPSMRWRYISINAKALQAITKHKSDGTYEGNVNLFYSIFSFKKFSYESLDEVLESQNKFTCFIQTDGFGVCFAFARKAKEEKATTQLGLEDFSGQEIQECFQPYAVDPGRAHAFTATIQHEGGNLETRRCSEKERQCYNGAKRSSCQIKKLKLRTDIKTIETGFPSAKTVNMEKTNAYVTYALINIPRLFHFYDEKPAPFCFYDYQGRQRSNAEMANILINGGKKYSKTKRKKTKQNRKQRKKKRKKKQENSQMPSTEEKERVARRSKFQCSDSILLFIFGDDMKNKDTAAIRGHVSGVTGILQKELLQRSRQFKNVLVGINKFRTSKVCNSCKQKQLE